MDVKTPLYVGFGQLNYTTRSALRLFWCQKVPISRDFLRIFNFHSLGLTLYILECTEMTISC